METKKWHDAGDEVYAAFFEMQNFGRTFEPELTAKISVHKTLEGQAAKLRKKVFADQGDFDGLKAVSSDELAKHEAKIRADLSESPAAKKPGTRYVEGGEKFEADVVELLAVKAAKLISSLRSTGLDLLKTELAEAETLLEIQSIEEQVFQARRQMARKFCLSLFQVAGLALGNSQYNESFPEMQQAQAQEKKLRVAVDIAAGKAKIFEPLRVDIAGTIDILCMAARLPKSVDAQLIDCWIDAKNKRCQKGKITFDARGVLTWRFEKSREPGPGKKIGFSSSDYTGGRALTPEGQAKEDARIDEQGPRFPKETFYRD